MNSALASLSSRGDYMFRVEHFTAEISSCQGSDGYQPRADIHLECERVSGDWPAKFWPFECRIVGATISNFDKTDDGQLVLGMVRLDSDKKAELGLIAGAELVPSLLGALNQNLRQVFLKVETTKKVQDWNGEGWIPVVSFSLVLGRRVS